MKVASISLISVLQIYPAIDGAKISHLVSNVRLDLLDMRQLHLQ